jgi:hypothetical protein
VILSPREQEAVKKVASSYNVDGDPETLIDEALQAICIGQADEVAYAVGHAAGCWFIGEFIWGKDRREIVNATQARELIAQAKQDQTYEGPIPDDDAKALEEANALIELATDAWNDNVRGSEVEKILRMAATFEENGATAAEPVEEPVGVRGPDQPAQDARPDLIENAVAAFRTDDLDELAKIEPWEDYSTEKVADIINGINAAIETYSMEEMYELLRNIWAYESSKRNRKTVLDAVEEVHNQIVEAQRAEGQTPYAPPNQIPRPAEAPESPEAEEAPAAEPEAEPEPQEPEPEEPDAEPDVGREAPEPVPAESADAGEAVAEIAEERPVEELAPDDPYRQLVGDVTEEFKRERVHIPEPPTEVAPQVPWDWTKISDQELQRLHSTFSGFGYYVDYKLARESRIALHCKQIADELGRTLLIAVAKEHAKSTPVSILEAEVESDENVKLWRRRQRRHDAFASALRSERDSYYKLLEALSRHESMRMDEWQRAGNRTGSILRRAGGK